MTTPPHDSFVDSLAAYALDALDAAEHEAFEAHLDTCASCRQELADLRRVTAGLGLATPPVTPPPSLKARALAAATNSRERADAKDAVAIGARHLQRSAARRATFGWLAAAASLALAIGAGIYASSLRSQIHDLQDTVADASARANSLRNSLDEARRETARLSRVLDIVQGPGTLFVSLGGTPDAPRALGRAYFSAARGLAVSTEQMPALRPGRAYQLWMVLPRQKPLSAGVFDVSPDGAATFVATVPAAFTLASSGAVTLAITEEPAGGSDGPTTPILLAGEMRGA